VQLPTPQQIQCKIHNRAICPSTTGPQN